MGLSSIQAYDCNGIYRINFDYEEIDECPMCHFALRTTPINACFVEDTEHQGDTILYVTFFCPKCRRVFMASFLQNLDDGGRAATYLDQVSLTPVLPNYDKFTSQIKALSPTFIQTYEQSQYAETIDLAEICGVGYRKALEYLVKDYLCHIQPDQEEAIKTEALGQSIKRINNEKIKTLAERAAWIGNDETHYVRKHEDLDTEVMKRFINAMVRYIDSELAFEEAASIDRR